MDITCTICKYTTSNGFKWDLHTASESHKFNMRIYEDGIEAGKYKSSSLEEDKRKLIEALAPFTHEDLTKQLAANVQGSESPIYGRNHALLYLKDFQLASRVIAEVSK